MASEDPFGDRMKAYEMMEAGRKLMPGLPIMIRADGKSFSKFTSKMERTKEQPYHRQFIELMAETMLDAMRFTNARIGYVQSDEISLVIHPKHDSEEVVFGGRIQKLTSLIAARVTAFFNSTMSRYGIDKVGVGIPMFDCRVWNVPNETEAVNTLLWREVDASKNSVQMAARTMFSHHSLQNKSSKVIQEMMFKEFGINWNDYPSFFKRGIYGQRVTKMRKFTEEERINLPLMHEARNNPNLEVMRSSFERLEFATKLSSITNRVDVLFDRTNIIQYE